MAKRIFIGGFLALAWLLAAALTSEITANEAFEDNFALGFGKEIASAADEERFFDDFNAPPDGYGEVPFWWWTGEKLDKERLLWEVDELHRMGITGVQVNYAHQDTSGWRTYPNDPEIFTDDWWDAYETVAARCGEYGMGIGLSGYTIDWQNSPENLYARIIYSDPETQSQTLFVAKKITVKGGESISEPLAEGKNIRTVAVLFYPKDAEGKIRPDLGISLLDDKAQDGKIEWTAPKAETGQDAGELWFYAAERCPWTLNPFHPEAGKRVIDRFFQPFEDRSPSKTSKGLNYFFHDELQLGTGPLLWIDDLPDEFYKRKGYSLFEALPAFFADKNAGTRDKVHVNGDWETNDKKIGYEIAADDLEIRQDASQIRESGKLGLSAAQKRDVKYRLDYFDVRVRLAEERYFKPIYQWHRSRGMIYACDPGSRGYNPFEFCDYFSAIRWYTAPGHDTPGGRADFIKNKVSSSIAHFYHQPRVWLEGYHSFGWGAAPEQIFNATCENFVYGANLLNLHGLYYSTYGGWWEWAPPCYHFRMPYWNDFGSFLKYFERLSFLTSQGRRQADLLIYYPVSAFQAGLDGNAATETAFEAARRLSQAGFDFFFVDDDSLARGEVCDGQIIIDGQAYRGLILPRLRGVREKTLLRASELAQSGGMVAALGALPEASDRIAGEDAELDREVAETFREGFIGDKEDGELDWSKLIAFVEKRIPRDLENEAEPLLFQHRTFGKWEIYLFLGAKSGDWLTFRTSGKPEYWDPASGTRRDLAEYKILPADGPRDADRIAVRIPNDERLLRVFLFNTAERPAADSVTSNLTELTAINPPAEEGGVWTASGWGPFAETPSVEITQNGKKIRLADVSEKKAAPKTKTLGKVWESEIIPTCDNRFGDFRLPIDDRFIGPEARRFDFRRVDADSLAANLTDGWENAQRVTYGYGPQFWRLGPLPDSASNGKIDAELAAMTQIDPSKPVVYEGKEYFWTPYSFSWREGIEGDPGHQGYHGLKENLDDRFIGLGAMKEGLNETLYVPEEGGNVYYLWTSVRASAGENVPDGSAEKIRVLTVDSEPNALWLGGVKMASNQETLTESSEYRPFLIRYNEAGRRGIVLAKESPELEKYLADDSDAKRTPLSMKWFDLPGRLAFNPYPDANQTGLYRFTAPPGLREMTITAKVPVRVWAEGSERTLDALLTTGIDGGKRYCVVFDPPLAKMTPIILAASPQDGLWGGLAFPEPVRLTCGTGEIELGDWGQMGALEAYSGKIRYAQDFTLTADEANSDSVTLRLGGVSASARIVLNGQEVARLTSPPWDAEVKPFLREGANRLEVEAANTLSNHYLTIPTRYRGNTPSGLFGPVTIEFRNKTLLAEPKN